MNDKRRHRTFYLLLLLVSVITLGLAIREMVVDLTSAAVFFPIQNITPIDGEDVCPGDLIRYKVTTRVNDYPVQIHVVEQWCEPWPGGACDIFSANEGFLSGLVPRNVTMVEERRVTTNLDFAKPGAVLELHHTARDGETTGYIVGPVTIAEDCE